MDPAYIFGHGGFLQLRAGFLKNGRAHGRNILGITVWNFRVPKTGMSTMGDKLLYARPLEVSGEEPVSEKSFLSDDVGVSILY